MFDNSEPHLTSISPRLNAADLVAADERITALAAVIKGCAYKAINTAGFAEGSLSDLSDSDWRYVAMGALNEYDRQMNEEHVSIECVPIPVEEL